MTHGKACVCPNCMNEPSKRVRANGMTLGDAKVALKMLRGVRALGDFMDEALDVTLCALDEVERQALQTGHAETLEELKAENAELLGRCSALVVEHIAAKHAYESLVPELAKRNAENAELRRHAERLLKDKARLAWFEKRQKLVDDLLTVYRVMADPDNESIVEAVGRLFDFDVTDPKSSEGT